MMIANDIQQHMTVIGITTNDLAMIVEITITRSLQLQLPVRADPEIATKKLKKRSNLFSMGRMDTK
jgi:hypothetical protein